MSEKHHTAKEEPVKKFATLPTHGWSPGQNGYAVPGGLGGQWLARGGDGAKPRDEKGNDELSRVMGHWKAGGAAR
ncbi:hypothetical protein Slin14017_G036560 [Septoria linicola]|nr:hypothetical protein Slin14017_G036560 [Septoria linicola]